MSTSWQQEPYALPPEQYEVLDPMDPQFNERAFMQNVLWGSTYIGAPGCSLKPGGGNVVRVSYSPLGHDQALYGAEPRAFAAEWRTRRGRLRRWIRVRCWGWR